MSTFIFQVVAFVICAFVLYEKLDSESAFYNLYAFIGTGIGLTGVTLYWWWYPLAECTAKCGLDEGQQGWWIIPLTILFAFVFRWNSKLQWG